jgi:restriction endonuclease S subunit
MSEWKKVKIGDFLKQYRNTIYVDDSQQYKQVTISSKSGVKYRCSKIGKEIGRKRQFLIDLKTYPNTVIFTRQGLHEGSIGLAPQEVDGCIVTENMPMFSVDETIVDTFYLKYFLLSPAFSSLISILTPTGSAQKSIHERDLLPLEISLPDLQTQQKIVCELAKKIEKVELIKSEIESQKAYAKQLRQNILQEAIEGKLTEEWRKENPVVKGNPDFDAEALFEKIQQEQVLNKHQKTRSQKRVNTIDLNTPEGWKWVKLRQIIDVRDGTHDTPSYVSSGYPLITGKDFYYGFFKLDKTQYVSRKDYEIISKRSLVEVGDILFSMIGGNIGSMIQITAENFFEMAIKNVALFKNDKKGLVNQKWMYYFIKGNAKNFQNDARGGAQPFVSLNYLRDFACCLPPLAEQKEIVTRVEQLLQTITQLETQIATRETTTKQLMQSILKDAFEK